MTGDLHVIPLGDLRDHTEDRSCWCRPMEAYDYPRIIIHNSMDRREHTIEKGWAQ